MAEAEAAAVAAAASSSSWWCYEGAAAGSDGNGERTGRRRGGGGGGGGALAAGRASALHAATFKRSHETYLYSVNVVADDVARTAPCSGRPREQQPATTDHVHRQKEATSGTERDQRGNHSSPILGSPLYVLLASPPDNRHNSSDRRSTWTGRRRN